MRVRHCVLSFMLAIVPILAHAEPIRLSTAGPAVLGGLDLHRGAVAELQSSLAFARLFFDERSFPNAEDVDAVHVLTNGLIVLSTAAGATLGSPSLTFQDGDLVAYDPIHDTASVIFSESTHFATNQDIDAVCVRPDGTLVLSTREAASLGVPPVAFSSGDVVAYDPVRRTASILVPSSRFVGGGENVDAVHVLPDGRVALSVERDVGASLGGITFRDGDVVLYDPVSDGASLFLSESVFSSDEDVDALHLGCGNGVVEGDEECDEAGETGTCHADCTIPTCGDGVVDPALGEECDDRGESVSCDRDCTAVACGDGVANATAGEECDDAGESAACDIDCTIAECGDGTTNASAGETCDAAGESVTCDLDCTAAVCGDATLNSTRGESCDDGGTLDGDCCSAACALDVVGTPCPDDGDACTTVDACDGAGVCEHRAEPAPDCRQPTVAGKASLTIKDKPLDAKDQLIWKWTRGPVTLLEEFGDPETSDDYTLCLYEEGPTSSAVRARVRVPAGGTCRGRACWRLRRSGLKYLDKDLTPDGALKLDLKEGVVSGKAKIMMQARGEQLAMPTLPLAPPFRVQLLADNGACWEARYDAAGIRTNDGTLLRARSE